MRRMKPAMVALLAAVCISPPVFALERAGDRLKIEAFIVSGRPLVMTDVAATCCKVTAYRLDGLSDVTAALGADLPNNAAAAEQIVKRAFAEREVELNAAAQEHAEALEKAIAYGLTRYPALVFNDGESVIYGVTDLELALQIYRRADP